MSVPTSWLLPCALLAALPAAANSLVLDLDPARSQVMLTLGATLHTVRGSVGPASGRVEFDPVIGSASAQVTVDLTAAETGDDRRDRKMHKEILQTAEYPRATYRIERIDIPEPIRQGDNDLRLDGVLDFHGASHSLALRVHAVVDGDRVIATSSVTIPYVEWGLRDPSFFLLRVDKAVTLDIRVAGRLSGVLPESDR